MMRNSIRFLVDENLLGLAKKLRMMGFDAASCPGVTDTALLTMANQQERVLLTKDRQFMQRISEGRGYLIKKEVPEDQLIEVMSRFNLKDSENELARCFECNALIEEVEKELVRDRVDPKTFDLYQNFFMCPQCHRVYWEGSHFIKLQNKIRSIKENLT